MTSKVSQLNKGWGARIPELDNITFAELLDEAKMLIPQYAPEWTDFNLHDPGITIIELIAWIVESQIFQLDQITEKDVKSFLSLLGQNPQKNEKIKDAKMRAQIDIKKLYKAVTLDDFEQLAIETPGVSIARVKALWNNNCVQIVVVPETVQTAKPHGKPLTVEEIKSRVYRHLDKRRILTALIEVIDPEYVTVFVKTTIKIKPRASAKCVKRRIKEMLRDFFNPIGKDGLAWPFGRNVYASEVISKIEDIEGVDRVQDLVLSKDGISTRKDLEVNGNALTKSGKPEVIIVDS